MAEPVHKFAPVSRTAPERVKATLQAQRLRCTELEKQLNEMKQEIHQSSVKFEDELSRDITTIIGNASVTPWIYFGRNRKKC